MATANTAAWTLVNSNGQSSPAEVTSPLKLFTPPKTDIWRPSPDQDDFNAPFIYTTINSATFKRLTVSVSADWKTQFDQGGLLIYWPAPVRNQSQWVKTGIEYFQGKPALSVVGTDRFSDWSLCPMPDASQTDATIEAERIDQTLWVYLVVDGEKRPLREIKWAFLEERNTEAEMWVGVYAAKPTSESEGDLETGIEVTFQDLKLETTP